MNLLLIILAAFGLASVFLASWLFRRVWRVQTLLKPKPWLAFRFGLGLMCLAALLVWAPRARAADYAVQKTFWSFNGTWTNGPTIVTNLNAAIDLTTVTDFSLQVLATPTNNSVGAGSFDIVWETSLDGVNWPGTTNQVGRTIGWFSAPFQSNALVSVWVTNITVDAIGYWRIRQITNQCNMNFTNLAIKGYIKPKRQNRDL